MNKETGMIETCYMDETDSDNRQFARHDATLSFSIPLIGAEDNRASDDPPMLVSHTCDVGAGGMALLIPSLPFLYRYLLRPDLTLNFELHLPDGPINVEAVPVYDRPLSDEDMNLGFIVTGRIEIEATPHQYERHEKAGTGMCCLVGVRIKKLSPADHARYMQYLEMMELERSMMELEESIMILPGESDESYMEEGTVMASGFASTDLRTGRMAATAHSEY
jgi:hypothetical protein